MTGPALFAQVPPTLEPFEGPGVDWYALSPLIVLLGAGLVLLVVAAPVLPGLRRRRAAARGRGSSRRLR